MLQDDAVATPSLDELVSRLKQLRGDPKDWMRREMALTRYVSKAEDHQRVLCNGEWRGSARHTPAVLVYDTREERMVVWITIGDNDDLNVASAHYFHSNIPHVGIARETFSDNDTSVVVG
jgi:hypothetical protein